MSTSSKSVPLLRTKYHPGAYHFVDAALRYTQKESGRRSTDDADDEAAHITGGELLQGIRRFALQEFGLMTLTVFHQWGVHCTDDFGRIVFELIEQGAMRKTENDQLSDFCGVYDFDEAFDRQYHVDVSKAFRR